MAYIGKSIESGTFAVLDTSGNTYNGSNTTFNLGTQVGSAAQLLVSHDGVIQKAGTDYTLATGGTQITFSTAPASGASIFITEISGAVGAPMNRDINGDELILDADADTSITSDTDDQIDIHIAGADDFRFTANNMNVLSGSTLTIDSGATITNSGTASGFGITWNIGSAYNSNFNASAGNGYFVSTSGGAVTATLPASPSAGDEIRFIDLSATFDTNNLTVGRNGKPIMGAASDLTVATERAGLGLVFSDDTNGWLLIDK